MGSMAWSVEIYRRSSRKDRRRNYMNRHTEEAAAAWMRAVNIAASDDEELTMWIDAYRRVIVNTAFIFKLTGSAVLLQHNSHE